MNEEKKRQVVDAAVARLQRAGWKAVAEHRGDVLVLGARGISGVERVLLGSVASGALNNFPVVLRVRQR